MSAEAPTIRPLLQQRDVLAIVKKSRPTLWAWCRKGLFPRSMKIGPNSIAWRAEAVERWLAERPVNASPTVEVSNRKREAAARSVAKRRRSAHK